MESKEPITLARECEVITIPDGTRGVLPAGAHVRLMQRLGGSYTVSDSRGALYRIGSKDADALGMTATAEGAAAGDQPFSEKLVWDELRKVFDPEIPVNIVDLGLVYSCDIKPLEQGGNRIDIRMSMTAPGCGMGNVIKGDVESRLSHLPAVSEVHVEVTFDPPWGPARMSEAAKLQLGLDADYGSDPSLPIYPK
jgi:probable FeS assembly SUF system protein SufT